ncbi:hypothetical protein TRP8649_00908 [Pelagimonas phthalicica]|uniref:Uncharacterized protein n=1 Tax=Pelagimonas phthalicica TaxID=1037362 RepID=A0A238JAB7_9RHOB|nr:hypothetical protein [Pelagimonas phthalicica]TDS94656.1 hypothetical protein CLV87_1163 [Pelagimonas phthalicica]SMX26816.1 hypothetical protein TRP8649_00908 [Pelagimonas phthalicica]
MRMSVFGKAPLIAVQLTGLILSALLVMVTFTNPTQVEERLQSFAIAKVEEAADAAWAAGEVQLAKGDRAERLGALARRFGLEAEALDLKRQQIVPALLSYALSDRCQENCETWAALSVIADSAMMQRVAQLRIGTETVQDFVLARYESSVRGLLLDLRRFGLVNVVVLSLMLGLVLFRDVLNWRFTAFSIALTGYSAWAAYGYVAKQNWALTILLQDWAAPGYQMGMIFVACLFFDWLFLRGKITEMALNALSGLFGG